MMGFKFGFVETPGENVHPLFNEESPAQPSVSAQSKFVADALEVQVLIDSSQAADELGVSEAGVSDVVPGKYEGGFKLWEGARDLTKFILTNCEGPWETETCKTRGTVDCGCKAFLERFHTDLSGAQVLELGCGHGLPGIACLLAGSNVVFHDLNTAVLRHATGPNVKRNVKVSCPELTEISAHFIDGDFFSAAEEISKKFGSCSFDMILTAETIYNENSAKQLLEAFDKTLGLTGCIILAAKNFYFGVGGGASSFKRMVDDDKRFQWFVIEKIDDGSNNVRQLIGLLRKMN